ncbi:MAG TPA: SUMF1/EgtB/PvdO family nonheme iron enzyme [Planctomycetaceae bacterium]|nr:SUMF1/EgtB/PvdO family nonheme iron enzyme [Planctomycetaceae bacterium]
MNDPAQSTPPAKPNDPRVQAALEDYFDRVDRHEPLDRETFFEQHADIADDLRQFIETEDALRKFAAESFQDVSQASTGSFRHQAAETLAPRQSAVGDEPKVGPLSGQFGRYRILRTLGQGAMGTVYLAEDTQLLRQVALKTPQFTDDSEQELLERFYREARAAATLRHPHICPVYDVGDIDGTHYITMAYIEGKSLSEFIKPAVPQTERQILIVIGKIAQALQAAHDRGIVHRDLKPANIMVDSQGEPVIMDFGLAQQIRTGEDVRLTQTGTILGSPAYMSPEQVEGDPSKVGPAADQYGLGVILYELLTGKVPFEGSLTAVMGQILAREPMPPSRFRPGLDPRIDAVCLKMLAKNPADRFLSLAAVAAELASILRNPADVERRAALKPGSPEPPRRPWVWWALGSAGAIALLAAVVVYVRVGKTVLEIQISDPGVQVAVRGSTLTLTGPASEEIRVDPGEHELTITRGDLKFKTGTFTLEKGNKQAVKISLAGSTVTALLGGAPLSIEPQGSSAKASQPVLALAPAPPLMAFPFNDLEAKKAQKAWASYLNVPIEATNTIGMKFKLVPPGEYMMGPFEGHHVRITRPSYFGTYEVTRGQFAKFVAATKFQTLAELGDGGVRLDDLGGPGRTKWEPNKKYTWREPGFPQEDDHPVVQLTWNDARSFCQWLSLKEGKKYRLPTEAEWEYACRAGTMTRFLNGNDPQAATKIANVDDASAKAVFPHWDDDVETSDGYVYTSPVGHFLPNNFGLYDTLGNAAEWCSDWWAAEYDKTVVDDPTGPRVGTYHVGRGGGFTHDGGTRYRAYGVESFRRPDWGFRAVLEIETANSGADSAGAASK